MFALIFGGEMIFSLPCHLPRYYRGTVLEVLGLTNADLGEACVGCGITAMSDYFPGGIEVHHLGAEADDHLVGSNRCKKQVLDGVFRLR